MAQEAGTSLMDLITSDPPPPGNPSFPPLSKGGASERPTKNVPPRKSNVQMTPELLGSIRTGASAKAGTGLGPSLKQKKKVHFSIYLRWVLFGYFLLFATLTLLRFVRLKSVCLQMHLMKPG